MFDRLKKAFAKPSVLAPVSKADAPSSILDGASSRISQWAGTQGLSFSVGSGGKGYKLEGQIGGKPWRLERGRPSRDFIKGEELRARAELGVREDATVMVINRVLKNDLDKRAFAIYTDSLKTLVDPNLPEEMRWLAMYEEVGWESLGEAFLNNYAILAGNKEDALAWISPQLVKAVISWPVPNPQTPFILMLLRGKAYLRMQYDTDDTPTLEHATTVFTVACELALGALQDD